MCLIFFFLIHDNIYCIIPLPYGRFHYNTVPLQTIATTFFLSLYSYCVDIVYPPSSIKTEEPKFQIDGDLCFIFLFSPFVSFQISSLRIRQQQCLLNWPNLTDKILYCICLGRYTVLYYNIKHRYSCWQVFFSLHHFNNIIV